MISLLIELGASAC